MPLYATAIMKQQHQKRTDTRNDDMVRKKTVFDRGVEIKVLGLSNARTNYKH